MMQLNLILPSVLFCLVSSGQHQNQQQHSILTSNSASHHVQPLQQYIHLNNNNIINHQHSPTNGQTENLSGNYKNNIQSYSPPSSLTSSLYSGTFSAPLISGSEQTSEFNWQASKSNVRERNAAMYNNKLMSDVTFVVGPKGAQEKIPAHKYVLATGSSVFYAMFFGGLADTNTEIEIPDVEPSAFLALLRYIFE